MYSCTYSISLSMMAQNQCIDLSKGMSSWLRNIIHSSSNVYHSLYSFKFLRITILCLTLVHFPVTGPTHFIQIRIKRRLKHIIWQFPCVLVRVTFENVSLIMQKIHRMEIEHKVMLCNGNRLIWFFMNSFCLVGLPNLFSHNTLWSFLCTNQISYLHHKPLNIPWKLKSMGKRLHHPFQKNGLSNLLNLWNDCNRWKTLFAILWHSSLMYVRFWVANSFWNEQFFSKNCECMLYLFFISDHILITHATWHLLGQLRHL